MKAWRSLLFVPANDATRLAKAHERGADALIIDLEDAVATEAKPAARTSLPETLRHLSAKGAKLVVRINSTWCDAFADLDAAVQTQTQAIMIPKAERPSQILVIGQILRELEASRNLEPQSIGMIALIESPAALENLNEIAKLDGVIGLALGTEDFSLALGVAPSPVALDLPARQIALAAANRSLMAFATPISISAFKDEAAYLSAALTARSFGGTGAICVHPNQVRIANTAFQPTAEEIADAESILLAWTVAQQSGSAVTSSNGRMIDAPVVARAQRLLAAH